MKPRVLIRPRGILSYAAGLSLQEEARQQVESGEWAGILLMLQHTPVITIGRSGGRENLLASAEELRDSGVEVCDSGRGGNITCHNPGQLVGYPIMNLSCWREDVHWYVRQLEETLIRTLQEYGIIAGRKAKYTGVWVENRKITAIGVSARRWITGHGFALNISNDLKLFGRIVPCGIEEFGVTSLRNLGSEASLTEVQAKFEQQFAQVFSAELHYEQEV